MAKILIAFATSEGQTEKIAHFIGEGLRAHGHDVTLCDVEKSAPCPDPAQFDAALLGASVHYDRYQHAFRDYVATHNEQLKGLGLSAFFSVSGAASSPQPPQQERARRYIDDFEKRYAWRPDMDVSVAGAIFYTQYNPIKRWVMKRISAATGRDTDTRRDFEYTDWHQLEVFVGEFAEKLPRSDVSV